MRTEVLNSIHRKLNGAREPTMRIYIAQLSNWLAVSGAFMLISVVVLPLAMINLLRKSAEGIAWHNVCWIIGECRAIAGTVHF